MKQSINTHLNSNEKLAIILVICVINLLQAQREKTINVSMTSQSVLSKIPKHNLHYLPPITEEATKNLNNPPRNDHEIFFTSIFGLVN